MPQSSTLSRGMEVHKDAIAVADVATEQDAEGVDLGTIGTRQAARDHLVRKRPAKANHRVCVDEAGPWGDWLSRYLMKKGHHGWVVAPSWSPQQAGDRVKTDRRDAVPLARLMRSGELTPVYGPPVPEEAIRDLTRAREEAIGALKTATCRLNALLLRHDRRDTGRAAGGPAHLWGLSAVVCPPPAQQIVFQEDGRAVTAHTARLPRLAQARHAHVHTWRLPPGGEALQALRGVQCIVAVPRGAALGDLPRVDHPRQRMT